DYLQLPHHVCTEPYRAPEVVDSRRYSAASDVWAVGLMLAELAQGRLCYVTKPSAHPTTVSQGDVGSRVLPAPQPLPQRYVSREDLAQCCLKALDAQCSMTSSLVATLRPEQQRDETGGATHNSVAKRASAARLACGEIA
ncbi:hypothetical protein QJQ45_016722, partial [Haematococcus lacustris]